MKGGEVRGGTEKGHACKRGVPTGERPHKTAKESTAALSHGSHHSSPLRTRRGSQDSSPLTTLTALTTPLRPLIPRQQLGRASHRSVSVSSCAIRRCSRRPPASAGPAPPPMSPDPESFRIALTPNPQPLISWAAIPTAPHVALQRQPPPPRQATADSTGPRKGLDSRQAWWTPAKPAGSWSLHAHLSLAGRDPHNRRTPRRVRAWRRGRSGRGRGADRSPCPRGAGVW